MIATLVGLAALWTPGTAAAGGLATDSGGNLLYSHLDGDEDHLVHDILIEPDGAGRYRFTDAGADIFICSDPVLCNDVPCDEGLTPREVICDAVPSIRIVLADAGDHVENRSAIPLFACGGAGNDVITGGSGPDFLGGGAGRDELHGGAGKDLLAVDAAHMIDVDPVEPPPEACEPGPDPERFELLDGGDDLDQIMGGPGDDVVFAGAGDDSVLGFAGDDRLDGGPGVDDLGGLEGDDVLAGGDDRDFLFGGPGDDRLDGGPGDDDLGRTLRYDADGLGTDIEIAVATEDGDDRLDGGPGDDHLTAGPGSARYDTQDSIALLQQDRVDRRLQSPVLNGADHFIGGAGDDLVTYVNRDLPVQVTLDGVADDGSAGEGDLVEPDVDRVVGGARGDLLVAAPGGSLLVGEFGPDLIVGGQGADLLSGGLDDSGDVISGAGGGDQIAGNAGDDALDAGAGNDIVFAGSGDDTAAGGDGDDRIEGATGSDRLDGGAGVDCLHGFRLPESEPACATGQPQPPPAGADGDDALIGGPGLDRLYGGDGEDVADYSSARSRVVVVLPGAAAGGPAPADLLAADVEGARGGRGPDVLIGNAADNVLDGGPGDDHVDGAGGVDRLRGGSGQDFVVARDGEPDAVRCGTKRDLALIDGEDELVAALSDVCERVDGGGTSLGRPVGPIGDCTVAIRPHGVARAFALRLRASLPPRTLVDTSSCAARVGGARVRGGAFTLEVRGPRVVLRLAGGRAGACRGSGRRVRRLEVRHAPWWLAVRGRERTVSGAGASWTTIDGCRGTRVNVSAGRVRTTR